MYIKNNIDKNLKSNEKLINLKEIQRLHSKTRSHIQKLSLKRRKLLDDFLNKQNIDIFSNEMLTLTNIFRFKLVKNKKSKKSTIKKIKPDKINECFGKYKMISSVGSGAFGNAYLVEKNKKQYCIKVIQIRPNNLEMVENEIKISKELGKHGICPKVYNAYLCENKGTKNVYIIMDFMNGGTLTKWLETNILTKKAKDDITSKINKLHKLKYIHNDIHGENILVHKTKKKTEFFISDFGLSGSFDTIIKNTKNYDLLNLDYLFKHQMNLDKMIAQLFIVCGII